MQIDKSMVLELLRSQGQDDKVAEADSALPDKVDPNEHAGLLEQLGINPQDLLGKMGGLGGLGG